jgi:hypothetical protein
LLLWKPHVSSDSIRIVAGRDTEPVGLPGREPNAAPGTIDGECFSFAEAARSPYWSEATFVA